MDLSPGCVLNQLPILDIINLLKSSKKFASNFFMFIRSCASEDQLLNLITEIYSVHGALSDKVDDSDKQLSDSEIQEIRTDLGHLEKGSKFRDSHRSANFQKEPDRFGNISRTCPNCARE